MLTFLYLPKKLFYYLIIPFLLYFHHHTQAQNEGNIWYFGNRAGLDFNSGSPVVLTDGEMNTLEGCASIADVDGNLLFYTNGVSVWNKNHSLMPNGTGLTGSPASTQSGVIVPYPSNPNLYYVFTVGAECSTFAYSIVDMTLEGGLGDIVTSSKNTLLISNATEKVTAIRHANGRDIWVLAHEAGTDAFHAYLVSNTGINPSPVISNIGLVHSSSLAGSGCTGYMKASPDGSKVALGLDLLEDWELFDFDNSTGVLSNPMTFLNIGHQAYGIEFSPDVSHLYVSAIAPAIISQYDLSLGSFSAIEASQIRIFSGSGGGSGGALQLAPDEKIYFCRNSTFSLGVINKPNETGIACDYQDSAIDFIPRRPGLGLPTFIQSFFLPLDFTVENLCFGNTTQFTITSDVTDIVDYHWDFGDGHTSDLINPSHIFNTADTFNVQLTITYTNGHSLSISKDIHITPVFSLPSNITGNDMSCQGETIVYQVDDLEHATSYEWTIPTGVTITSGTNITENPQIELFFGTDSQNGIISVKGVNECFESEISLKNIKVIHPPSTPSTIIGKNTLCQGETVIYQVNDLEHATTYEWTIPTSVTITSGTSTTENPQISLFFGTDAQNGTISVKGINECFEGESSILNILTVHDIPLLSSDTLCLDGDATSIQIPPANNFTHQYTWDLPSGLSASTSSTTNAELSINVSSNFRGGNLRVKAENVCGESDWQEYLITRNPDNLAIQDTTICDFLRSSSDLPHLTWQWYKDDETIPSARARIYQVLELGNYRLEATNLCGEVFITEDFNFTEDICSPEFGIPNAFSPNGDGLNDVFEVYSEHITKLDIKIYNRWGELIAIIDTLNPTWNGTLRGKPVPDGIYIYKGSYVNIVSNKKFEVKGTVTIMR